MVNNASSYVDEAFLRIEELLDLWLHVRGPERDSVAKSIFTSILIILDSDSLIGGIGVYDLLRDYMKAYFPPELKFSITDISEKYVKESLLDAIKTHQQTAPLIPHEVLGND